MSSRSTPTSPDAAVRRLAEFRRRVSAELRCSGVPAHFHPTHPLAHLHWRDIYTRHRSKTQLIATPDPRSDPSYSPPSLQLEWWSDARLLRFLRAKDGNIDAACAMFLSALSWRRSFGVDDLMEQGGCPFMDLRDSIVPETIHAHTKTGARLYFAHYGLIDVERVACELMPHIAWVVEAHRMEIQARETVAGDQLCVVFDAEGVTFHHRHLIPWIQANELIDNSFFPEFYADHLEHLYIVNCPSFFPVLINLLKPLLNKRIRDQFVFLSHDYHQTLRDSIGMEFLPREYGGACKQCKGQHCIVEGRPGEV